MLEGVIAYFKVCIVIFGLVENLLLKITDFGEFFGFFDKFLVSYTDYAGFKTSLDSVFINKELLNKARFTLISKETILFKKSFNNNATEKCNTNSPYCFVKKEEVFSEYVNFATKEYNIVDNLKASHFNPYAEPGNKIYYNSSALLFHSHFKEFSNDSKTKDNSKPEMGSMTDLGFVRNHNNFVNLTESLVHVGTKVKSDQLLEDMSIPTDRLKESVAPSESMDSPSKNVEIDDKEPIYNVKNTAHIKPINLATNIDRNVLCIRSNHVCEFSVLDRQKKEHMQLIKTNFLNSSSKQFEEYIGPFITNLYYKKRSRYAIKLNKIDFVDNSSRLNINYRIKRTSFEIRKRHRFISMDYSPNVGSQPLDKETFLNIFKNKPKKEILVKTKDKSKQDLKIDLLNDEQAEKSDEEFLSKFKAKYKTSILKSFLINESKE